jgi:hypothetical protein
MSDRNKSLSIIPGYRWFHRLTGRQEIELQNLLGGSVEGLHYEVATELCKAKSLSPAQEVIVNRCISAINVAAIKSGCKPVQIITPQFVERLADVPRAKSIRDDMRPMLDESKSDRRKVPASSRMENTRSSTSNR